MPVIDRIEDEERQTSQVRSRPSLASALHSNFPLFRASFAVFNFTIS
jgi:hypothetical protein